MGIYFSLFGFSMNKATRIGQYVGIGAIVFFIIDETFKQGWFNVHYCYCW